MGLKPKIIKPSDFINPLLSKKSVEQEKFEKFQNNLNELLKVNKIESEEHQKNAVRDFLVHSFGYEINTKARIDWAIFKNAKVEVLIEAKRLDNLTEMLTKDELNRKAFHEAILYFMQERADGNINLKHIIILTAFSWFIFDAKDFDRLFWQNKQINKIYTNYKNPSLLGDKTKDFYESIAKELQKLQANLIDDLEIECAYFNLQEPHKPKDLIAIYKLLSPDTLLKEFNPNDANSLNREFYNELLYILGLEETKQGSKKIISKATNSQSGSLYENISNKLVQYGKLNDFETIIKLIIIWINRILFLKLLESQIVSWNKNKEFKFLNSSKIDDYDKLEMLFFEILAKRPQNRTHREFDYIPYLNSSLFEIHANEDKYLKISNLEGDAKINYYSKTVLKDEKRARKKGQTLTLAYLFEFLDAYDFGSTSDEIANESKSLINASVLGLIFEKINGYKDGSFYTPSFITMYMARESLQKSIIEKFNSAFEIEAANFEELKNYCDKHNYKNEFIQKANKIIDSITLCDPAVGSGHFLVSALNEIIYIKYQLGLFNLRGLKIELINDELLVKLEDEWFEYTKPKDFQSPNHTVQKMLFLEKQRIIENQLFGVDINPNSSQITKLRLWIELLKNSYYDKNYELVTLPNIDINIKTGNSLISRFDLKDEIKINNIKQEIKNYKERVREYKENLGTKKDVLESIESLKNKFRLTLKAESKAIKERNIKLKEYVEAYKHENLPDELILVAIKSNYNLKPTLFDEKPDSKKQKILFEDLEKLQKKIDEIEKGKIYEDAFEWRFEFPEVLDEEGSFVGFDIVIGNPPYVFARENFTSQEKNYFVSTYKLSTYQLNLYILFLEKAMSVLQNKGKFAFIMPNNWLTINSAKNIREFVLSYSNISIVNFMTKVFEDANVDTSILMLENSNHSLKTNLYESNQTNEFELITQTTNDTFLKTKDFLINIASFKGDSKLELLSKIESISNTLSEISDVKAGLQAYEIGKGKPIQTEEMKKARIYHSREKLDETYIAYLDGKNVSRYILSWNKEFLKYGDNLAAPRKFELFSTPRILVRQIPSQPPYSIHACYTNEIVLNDRNSMNIVNLKEEPLYVLAILNSKLMTFWFIHKFGKLQRGIFPQFKINELEQFPIAIAKDQQPFINLANEILTLKKQNPKADTTDLETQIDQMVYELYDLSDEEIEIVEGKK